MAGYFLYTIDGDVFSQLTAAPTKAQGDILADWVLEDIDGFLDDCEADPSNWPGRSEFAVSGDYRTTRSARLVL